MWFSGTNSISVMNTYYFLYLFPLSYNPFIHLTLITSSSDYVPMVPSGNGFNRYMWDNWDNYLFLKVLNFYCVWQGWKMDFNAWEIYISVKVLGVATVPTKVPVGPRGTCWGVEPLCTS